jgi:signal transduction histidine kinase
LQLQSVPIEIGGETAATLSLGRRFDLARSVVSGDAVLLKNGTIVLSTFRASATEELAAEIHTSCPHLEAGCELPLLGQSYVVSDLQRDQLGSGYRLLGLHSIDAGLQAFNRAFVPLMLQIGVGGVLLALLCTILTSRSVSQPLRQLASQLEAGAKNGTFPTRLSSGQSVREIDLVVNAFNHVAEAERLSRYELIEAKHDAESANRLKTEFLTNISHELRTPMNGILGMTQLLSSTSLDEEQEEYAATVRDSAHDLLALIDDVLDFSQMETGEAQLTLSKCDLRVAFDDAVAATRARVGDKPIAVDAACDPEFPCRVLADESRLRQVLKQLCGNAVKFTHSGFVRISAQCLKKTEGGVVVKFSIQDTGIGIAPENLDLIFDRFTQVDGSLTRDQGGTGIGLCIAKSTIELMGGIIDVTSRPGIGSTFTFTLPLDLSESADGDLTRKEMAVLS